MRSRLRFPFATLTLLLATGGLRAEVTLAPLFTDGAVLQRDKSISSTVVF